LTYSRAFIQLSFTTSESAHIIQLSVFKGTTLKQKPSAKLPISSTPPVIPFLVRTIGLIAAMGKDLTV
jgi:hypothetical protein